LSAGKKNAAAAGRAAIEGKIAELDATRIDGHLTGVPL
jgi:hypothetical protein